LLRLLLPQLDRQRSNYGLKEQKLASIYIKVLGLDPQSADAISLLHYKDPGKNKSTAGDFTLKLQSLLRYRMPQSAASSLTVQDVNAKLDELASAPNADAKESIMRYFFGHCTLIEQIWLVRMILKDLDISLSEASILPLFHADAFKYFQVCADLKQLCEDLSDPQFRMENFVVRMFCPFAPQLSKRLDKVEEIPQEVGGGMFWIETKLDGERIQMHYENGRFEWWSRNTKDYTSMYGGTWTAGSLVPRMTGCFSSVVKNCILDGEMLAYNTETKSFEPFGSLKTASNEAAQHENAIRHPCFVAFDILYFNDQSLIDTPLSLRHQYLTKVLNQNTDYIQVLHHQVGYTLQDILDALDERMSNGEEGLIIKNPNANYVPNERTNSVKLKAEYIAELSDDIDCLIVGGYFGEGRLRSGQLGSFLCAIRDPTREEPHFITFCKFGSGFSMIDLPKISLFDQGNWKRFSPDLKLPWLTHVLGKENPDYYIEPRHSQVVQIRGSEIVPSVGFGAGHTLRFPRFVRLRHDKGYNDIMTMIDLQRLIQENKGRMQSKRAIETEPSPVKKKAKRQHIQVHPGYSGAESAHVETQSTIFEGKEFCLRILGSAEEKKRLEGAILEHGGTLSLNPTKNTFVIVCDKPSTMD
jgi:DNA ligase-4